MQAVTTIGLDIAKSVFQVHGVDAEGKVVMRRKLKRPYVLSFSRLKRAPHHIIGHASLRRSGHTVRLMPPAYVKPYVKRQIGQVDSHVFTRCASPARACGARP
jgi:transposase